MDDDKHPLMGTGEEFGRIDLGGAGELVVRDDGASGRCLTVCVERDGVEEGPATALLRFRTAEGDDALADALDGASGDGPPSGGRGETARLLSQPVSFKCEECDRTWPRTRNANVGDGPDVCEECADGGGDGS